MDEKLEKFIKRINNKHYWHFVELLLPAMANGKPPFSRPYTYNYIRLTCLAFINHIQHNLNDDLSNAYDAYETAIFSIPVISYSNRYSVLNAAKTHCKLMVKKGYINQSVLEQLNEIKIRRTEPANQPCFYKNQIEKLIALTKRDDKYCSPEINRYNEILDTTLIKLIWFGVLRISEVINLTIDCINFDEKIIYIKNSKNKKSRTIGINPDLEDQLRKYIAIRSTDCTQLFVLYDGSPLTSDRAQKKLSKLKKKAGINGSFHALRRGGLTEYANKGVPITKLSVIAGHSDISQTYQYIKPDERAIVSEMRNW